MEAEYLRATVGEALAAGMAQTAMTNPADPIEHLANWLSKYCDNIEDAKQQKEIYAQYQADEEAALLEEEQAKKTEQANLSLKLAGEAELEAMNEIITSETSVDRLWKSVLEFLKVKTGSSATYLGYLTDQKEIKEVDGEEQEVTSKVIKYVAASSNNQFMLSKVLAAKGEGKKAKGSLTLGLFDRVEDKPPPPAEGEEPLVEPEGGWPTKWKTPCLVVPQCVQEPRVQYFNTPKLGSYMAAPLQYTYQVDIINPELPPLVEGECPAYPEYTTQELTQHGVVAMDSLGTEREFGEEYERPITQEWTNKLAEGLARISAANLAEERGRREEFKAANMAQWATIKTARERMAESLPNKLEDSAVCWVRDHTAAPAAPAEEEEGAAAEEEAPVEEAAAPEEEEEAPAEEEAAAVPVEAECDKRLREALVKGRALTEFVNELWETVASLAMRTDAPSNHWELIQAVARFTLCEEKCESWEDCQKLLESLHEKMTDMKPFTAPRTVLMVQTIEAIKAQIADAPIQEVERTHAPITILLDWLNGAIEVAEAALECRRAAKAAVEEKGDEYTEQLEDEVTDKPVEEVQADEQAEE